MSSKKCLKTSRAWSFIEYAVVFAVITAAAVISFDLIGSTTSHSGRIQSLFRAKTDTYIEQIKTSRDITDVDLGSPDYAKLKAKYEELQALNKKMEELSNDLKELDDSFGKNWSDKEAKKMREKANEMQEVMDKINALTDEIARLENELNGIYSQGSKKNNEE